MVKHIGGDRPHDTPTPTRKADKKTLDLSTKASGLVKFLPPTLSTPQTPFVLGTFDSPTISIAGASLAQTSHLASEGARLQGYEVVLDAGGRAEVSAVVVVRRGPSVPLSLRPFVRRPRRPRPRSSFCSSSLVARHWRRPSPVAGRSSLPEGPSSSSLVELSSLAEARRRSSAVGRPSSFVVRRPPSPVVRRPSAVRRPSPVCRSSSLVVASRRLSPVRRRASSSVLVPRQLRSKTPAPASGSSVPRDPRNCAYATLLSKRSGRRAAQILGTWAEFSPSRANSLVEVAPEWGPRTLAELFGRRRPIFQAKYLAKDLGQPRQTSADVARKHGHMSPHIGRHRPTKGSTRILAPHIEQTFGPRSRSKLARGFDLI